MRDCILILFGALGDLAKKKIIPALYSLVHKEQLDNLHIIGTDLANISKHNMLKAAQELLPEIDEKTWHAFEQITHYQQLDINNLEDFKKLKEFIEVIEKKHNLSGNRLIYCATPSDLFSTITKQSHAARIITCTSIEERPWQRIIYEKPFGRDYTSAKKLNKEIHNCLNETQVYRVDHYLAKELIANITLLRFTNRMLEPQWNHHDIASVEIILDEEIGVAHRGNYYNQTGALRDVVQNHIFELLALVSMEPPTTITGSDLQEKRAEVLKNLSFDSGILGQYEGFRTIDGVKKDSMTETFAALKLFVNNERWKGVPFYIRTGKCLQKTKKLIHLNFKPEHCRLIAGCPLPANRLTIAIEPHAGFSLELNAKKPGYTTTVVPITMEFCHECLFGVYTPQAYEVI